MTNTAFPLDPKLLNIDLEVAAEAGRRYAEAYQSGTPYHHICIDDFLPKEVAEKVRKEAIVQDEKAAVHSSPQEHLKT